MLETFQGRARLRASSHTSMLAAAFCALVASAAISMTVSAQAQAQSSSAQDQTQSTNAQGQTQSTNGQDQDQPPSPASGQGASSDESGELQSVTVTARYKQESLQQAPLAITELSGTQLQAQNITGTADLGAAIPNLYTHPGDQEEGTTPTISMRGVTAGDYSFETSPAVGIYVDGVYHSTMVGAALDLADVDNIQVNRGPQGTLAGNSSIAGSIYINSKVPTGSDTGYVTVGYGAYNELEAMGAYDTTIAPNLYMRVFGEEKRQDGYVNQLDFTCEMDALGTPQLAGTFPSRDNSSFLNGCKIGAFGGTNMADAKVMLRYVATDKLEFNLVAAYYDENDEMQPDILLKPEPPASAAGVSNQLLALYGVVFDDRFLPPPGQPYSSYSVPCQILTGRCDNNAQGQNSTDVSLKIDYDITDQIHLTAIGAASLYGGLSTNNPEDSPLGYNLDQVSFLTNQYTGEVRVTGTAFDNQLNWVAGVFDISATNHLYGAIDLASETFTEDDYFTRSNQSGFFHVDYKLWKRLGFEAGVRYEKDSNTAALNHAGLIPYVVPFNVGGTIVNWLAGLNYQFTKDTMGYVTVATGSRPPGISTVVFTQYQLYAFPAEALTSYEVGLKNEFFDHRLRLNVDGFYMDYSTRITGETEYECLSGPNASPPRPVPLTSDCGTNAFVPWVLSVGAPAKIVGFEGELTAEPVPRLLLNADAGYNHFTSGVTTLGQPGYVYPGNYPQPQWNASAGAQYSIPMPGGGSLTPRLNWVFESLQTFGPAASEEAPTPLFEVPAYSVFNGSLAYTTNGKWTITASITNMFNKYYFYDIFNGSGDAVTGNPAPPREWSIELTHKFL